MAANLPDTLMGNLDARCAIDCRHRLHAAVNRHDADAVAAMCCDDVVLHRGGTSRHRMRRWTGVNGGLQ